MKGSQSSVIDYGRICFPATDCEWFSVGLQLISNIDSLSTAIANGEGRAAAGKDTEKTSAALSAELRTAIHKASHDAARLDLAVRSLSDSMDLEKEIVVPIETENGVDGDGQDIDALTKALCRLLGIEQERQQLVRGLAGLRKHADTARRAAAAAVQMAPVLEARELESAVRGVQVLYLTGQQHISLKFTVLVAREPCKVLTLLSL